MLKRAVDHYHELLEDDGLRVSSLDAFLSGMKENDLVFGGRPLSPYLRPHFVLESDWIRVKAASELIWSAIGKIKDAAIGSDRLLDELGVFGIERELVSIEPGYTQVSPTARLDSFLAGDSLSFVELNGESPAGIAYSDVASEIYRNLPILTRFGESYAFRTMSGRASLLSVLLSSYREFAGGAAKESPCIAIVDLKGLPTRREFEMFKDFFCARGLKALVCSPEDLEYSGGKLRFDGFDIDIVYKRLLVNEYLPIMGKESALLDAYRAGAVCMVNSFRSKLVHKKATFSILTDERHSGMFSGSELAAINTHIPWTRSFGQRSATREGESIDLVEWTRSNRSKLVLKPNDDYGGHGIFIGWTSSESEWDNAIATALADGDYLVQQRVTTAKELFPMIDSDGQVRMVEQLVDLDPFLFNGQVESAFTRLSTSELANVSSGGGMVPTFIIPD
jgi:hypothetical protein